MQRPATLAPFDQTPAFQRARQAVIASRLGLTDDQKAKIKDIRAKTAAAVQAVRADATITDPAVRQSKIFALRQADQEQSRAVLTLEQQTKLIRIMNDPRALRAAVQLRLRTGAIFRQIGITPEQAASIRAARTKAAEAAAAIKADTTLTSDQKHAKIHDARQACQAQVRAVLTPEQVKILAGIRRRLLAPLGPLN